MVDLLPSVVLRASAGMPVSNRWTHLSPSLFRFAVLLLVLLALTACRREPEPVLGAPQEPVAAVQALAGALRDGDLQRFSELSLPPAMHAQQAELWRRQWALAPPLAPETIERYNTLMADLTAPDAEAALWAKAAPRLAALEQEAGPKWTMGVTMLAGFASTAVAAHPTLSEAEKAHAAGVMDALKTWAQDRTRFTDEARVKQAIALTTRTARQLDLPTLEAARALEHDAMLAKASVVFRGAKDIAITYGIDVDAALEQMQAEVVQIEGARAVVRVSYPLLGQSIRFEQPMLQIDGGWYREDAVAAFEAALAEAGPMIDAAPVAESAAAGQDAVSPAVAPAN